MATRNRADLAEYALERLRGTSMLLGIVLDGGLQPRQRDGTVAALILKALDRFCPGRDVGVPGVIERVAYDLATHPDVLMTSHSRTATLSARSADEQHDAFADRHRIAVARDTSLCARLQADEHSRRLAARRERHLRERAARFLPRARLDALTTPRVIAQTATVQAAHAAFAEAHRAVVVAEEEMDRARAVNPASQRQQSLIAEWHKALASEQRWTYFDEVVAAAAQRANLSSMDSIPRDELSAVRARIASLETEMSRASAELEEARSKPLLAARSARKRALAGQRLAQAALTTAAGERNAVIEEEAFQLALAMADLEALDL